MAKMENTKMTVSLDNDSKRIIRNLTKAIDRLSRSQRPYEVEDTTKRLAEPAEEWSAETKAWIADMQEIGSRKLQKRDTCGND